MIAPSAIVMDDASAWLVLQVAISSVAWAAATNASVWLLAFPAFVA
jgi:hypothetical protein